jgi:cation diffusion facilitator CzcD-associated flavoprotein CzcO
VDNQRYYMNENFVWKGLMLEGLPNLAFSFGYFDASWTLGVDASARLAARLLRRMRAERIGVVVPQRSGAEAARMRRRAFLELRSTYVERGRADLPMVGDRRQWKGRKPWWWEWFEVRFGDVRTGLRWIGDGSV